MKMFDALRKNNHAFLERWNRGTYVFLSKDKHGNSVVWMQRSNGSIPFLLPYSAQYINENDFIPGKGMPVCIHCKLRAELVKKQIILSTKISYLKGLCERDLNELYVTCENNHH